MRGGGSDSTIAYLTLQATREGQAAHAHVHEIVRWLRAQGWEVELYEPRYEPTGSPSVARRLREFVRLQWSLAREVGRFRALYVRAHFCALPISLYARVRRVPVVQECNGPYGDAAAAWPAARRLVGVVAWMQRRQYAWADRTIAVTDGLKRWVDEEAGRTDTEVVANGANTDVFRPDTGREPPVPGHYVVFFGALAPWQGLPTILRATASAEWPQDVRLVVVGDGMMQGDVQRAARDSDRITYLGRLPYGEVAHVVAGSLASLSVQSDSARSSTGLSPLKVYESMACGVPTIVSEHPGIADIVRACRGGIAVPPDDPERLARAVADLRDDLPSARSMGERAREAAVRLHSWRARGADTARVLAEVIGAGADPIALGALRLVDDPVARS